MTKTTEADTFDFPELPLEPAPEGVSILLTGSDTEALKTVFYHLISAREDERSLVLATGTSGRSINLALDAVVSGASTRSTVLTCKKSASRSNAGSVGEISGLTDVGMQFSALVTESGTVAAPQRAGLLLGTDMTEKLTDMKSVSHFVNANFLAHLRRSNIMGVCGIDTSGTLTPKVADIAESMTSAFSIHLRVEAVNDQTINVHITDSDQTNETVSMNRHQLKSIPKPKPETVSMTHRVEVGD